MAGFLLDAAYTIISLLALLGNGLVVAVMLLRRRKFTSATNRLILHQSVMDCASGAVFFLQELVVPRLQVRPEDHSFLSQLYCKVLFPKSLLLTMTTASSYNLVSISLERLAATCYPVWHRNAALEAKVRLAMLAAWVIGAGTMLVHASFLYEAGSGGCRYTHLRPLGRLVSNLALVGFPFVLPLAALCATYTKILIVITRKAGNPTGGGREDSAMRRAKRNILVTILLVGGSYIASWSPMMVLFVYCKSRDQALLPSPWFAPLLALVGCNMFVNPIIYCFKYEHFCTQLKAIALGRRRGGNRVGDRQTRETVNTISKGPSGLSST